ncbi:DHA2 family efflux MFS transporter permease subunit [Isoptericola sp. NEAU-Y5]|uniref:DHA2 family efflux MFS transporter permease subunit n=1 Tax=Isoptericola luteus TaxID=2879484 RepID=A0ABS7ZGV6_9MICO|nr:MDR family MFS transporter [Isoptericola sp. NEAU-Y5]MCA5894148.1 DHA2 family efflux MFS transporter permease subunit [Isoptericola sp. NEAU-Y5]
MPAPRTTKTTPAPTAPARAPEAPPPAAAARLSRQNVKVIGLLLASSFVVILNETTMGVALPAIMAEMDVTEATGQWLTTAFMLTMAVVIPATGWIVQRLGTRGAFILAMAAFSTGTLLAAIAPAFGILVVARVVQATGTAIMMPLLMTTVMMLVPPAHRGRVMGNVSMVISVAPALGPTMSGLVVTSLGWRAVFWVVLPIALVSLTVGAVLVRDVADRARQRLDPLSLLLAVGGFGGLVYGLSSFGEAAQHAVAVPPSALVGAGAAFLAVFVWRQIVLQRTDAALLDLRVFRAPGFGLGLGLMALSFGSMLGTFMLLPIVTQKAMGISAVTTGLVMLPGGIAMGLLGPVVGNLYDRHGPRVLVLPGLGAVTAGMLVFASLSSTSPVWLVLAGHLVISLGLALVFTPSFTFTLAGLRPSLYSHGSAVMGTVQQLAGAAGTALFITLLTVRSVSMVDDGATAAAAMSGGARVAFLAGAALSLVTLVLATRLRRPAPVPGAEAHVGAH